MNLNPLVIRFIRTIILTCSSQVPTISVTPHSPGVLDDSLQQLRRLHAAVQRMRAAPLPLLVRIPLRYKPNRAVINL